MIVPTFELTISFTFLSLLCATSWAVFFPLLYLSSSYRFYVAFKYHKYSITFFVYVITIGLNYKVCSVACFIRFRIMLMNGIANRAKLCKNFAKMEWDLWPFISIYTALNHMHSIEHCKRMLSTNSFNSASHQMSYTFQTSRYELNWQFICLEHEQIRIFLLEFNIRQLDVCKWIQDREFPSL